MGVKCQIRGQCAENVKNSRYSTTQSNPIQKRAKDFRYFSEENTQMASEHTKGCSLAIKVMKIKTRMKYSTTPSGLAIKKKNHK